MTSPLLLDSPADTLAVNFTRLFSAIRASLVQQLFSTWFSLDSYREVDIDQWLEFSLPLVEASQETAALATKTYMDLQLQLLGIDELSEIDFALVTGEAIRNGVPPSIVYSRPFKELWDSLSRGTPFDIAVENAANRLRQLAETDIQLVHTHTSREILSRHKTVKAFRRVPTGTFTCALCLVASTQRYKSFDLMPIHPGCDCRVAPVIDTQVTEQIIDKEFLEEIHKAIERQFGLSARDARAIDYRKITLTRDHGEYGPTLTVSGHRFTGPNSIKDSKPL